MIWTRERLAEAAEHWMQGLSASEIASRLGVTRNAVIGAIDRNRERFPARREGTLRRMPAPVAAPVRKTRRFFNIRNERPGPVFSSQSPDCPSETTGTDLRCHGVEPVRFVDVTDRECRWPLWASDDVPGPNGLCCGAAINFGAVYCRHHKRKAATPRLTPNEGGGS